MLLQHYNIAATLLLLRPVEWQFFSFAINTAEPPQTTNEWSTQVSRKCRPNRCCCETPDTCQDQAEAFRIRKSDRRRRAKMCEVDDRDPLDVVHLLGGNIDLLRIGNGYHKLMKWIFTLRRSVFQQRYISKQFANTICMVNCYPENLPHHLSILIDRPITR